MIDLHKIWSHRWLSPKTEIKNSPICAVGVFAKENIEEGKVIRVTGGVVVPKSDINEYNKLMNYVVDNIPLDISDKFLLAPNPDDLKLTATINHSCSPNTGFLDTITIIAIKSIKPREEITWDYAFSQTSFEPFQCKCGSKNCRNIITPDDWKLEPLF